MWVGPDMYIEIISWNADGLKRHLSKSHLLTMLRNYDLICTVFKKHGQTTMNSIDLMFKLKIAKTKFENRKCETSEKC